MCTNAKDVQGTTRSRVLEAGGRVRRAGRRIKVGHKEEGAALQPAFTQASDE